MILAVLACLSVLSLDPPLPGLARDRQDDSTSLALAFEKMHCAECKVELEAGVKKLPGFRSVQVAGATATLVLEDKAALPALNRFPKDLVLQSAGLRVRGTAVFVGDKASLVTRGGVTLALANPEKPGQDSLGGLKKASAGGKNRFAVSGLLVGGKTLVVESFQAADWKD